MAEIVPDILRGVLRMRPTMVEMREFAHQEWRLTALTRYCVLLVQLSERRPQDTDLMDRIERAISEAERTQLWLDQHVDAMAS